MLIVSQPRCASTSLLYTLSTISATRAVNGIMRKQKAKGFEQIQRLHRICGLRTEQTLRNCLTSRRETFRLHLLPVKHHLDILDKYKINMVVVLREPSETVKSYMKYCNNISYYKVLGDMVVYNETWRHIAIGRDYIKLIEFSDLIGKQSETISGIMAHMAIKGKVIPLKKMNAAKDKLTYHLKKTHK